MSTATTAQRCTHCNGVMQSVTPARGTPFNRCTSCGRDDRPVFAPSGGNGTDRTGAAYVASTGCAVKGCPGTVLGGRCACCEKRAKWAEEHTPKRRCEICEGLVTGKGGRKYCAACGPVAQKAQIAKYKDHTATAKTAKR